MLCALPMQDTDLKKYLLRSRSRIIQFALTLILKQIEREYIGVAKGKTIE